MSNGTDPGCPCTSCSAAQDPQVVSNPPGLPAISDRTCDFTGVRRALLRPLPGEQAIGTWQPAPGDLGLQVLEWWAYLADVLTFYNERFANESYLRTATQAGSVANLVAPLGYQPAPGIAATGNLAAVSTPGHPAEPLVIPAGMSLSSTASPGVPAQTFEVDVDSGSAATFTGPSTVPVTLSPDTAFGHPVEGTPSLLSVLLAGRVSGVQTGDRLLLVQSEFAGQDGNDNWSLVTVTAVTSATDPGTGAVNTHGRVHGRRVGTDIHAAGRPLGGALVRTVFAAAGRPLGGALVRTVFGAAGRPLGAAGRTLGVAGRSLGGGRRTTWDSTTYRLVRPTAAAALFNAAALWNPSDPLSAGPSSEQTVAVIPPPLRRAHGASIGGRPGDLTR